GCRSDHDAAAGRRIATRRAAGIAGALDHSRRPRDPRMAAGGHADRPRARPPRRRHRLASPGAARGGPRGVPRRAPPPHGRLPLVPAWGGVRGARAWGLVSPGGRPAWGVLIWGVPPARTRRRLLVFAPGDVAPSPELTSELHVGYIAPLFMRGSRSNAIIVAV